MSALFASPSFWIAVAFCIFVLLTVKPIWKKVVAGLDAHAARVRASLGEAAQLREDAQKASAAEERRNQQSRAECVKIEEDAEKKAKLRIEEIQAEAGRRIQQARAQAEEERRQMIAEAKDYARARIVALALERARKKVVGASDDSYLFESVLAQLRKSRPLA